MSNNRKSADFNRFVEVCRRADKSGFKTLIFHNRMVMGFYDIAQDSDIGMHYILHIPDDYEDLYDGHFTMNVNEFLKKLNETRNKIKEERLKLKLPPRAVDGELFYTLDGKEMQIEIGLRIHDMVPPPPEIKRKTLVPGDILVNLGFMTTCKTLDDDATTAQVDLMLDSLNKVIERIEPTEVLIDVLENDLVSKVQEFPRVFYCKVKIDNESVQVPLMKSFFRGINKFDRLLLTVSKTCIKGIFVYTITLDAKGLTDQYIAYIQNFK